MGINMCYLRNVYVFLSVLCMIGFNCKHKKKDLFSYFEKEFNTQIPSSVHTIVVLDEVGCKGCNVSLSNWIQKKALDHKKIWVVVTATGAHLDISPYLSVKYKNVFAEQNIGAFRELDLFPSSGFIFLKERKVEKVYSLNARELEKQLKQLESRSL